MRFELFIAARYLRAKRRQAVISVITVISILGVASGVASLVVALAVNSGFTQDLQNRLVGATSHVNLVRTKDDGIENWRELIARLEKQPHVLGAAPALYDQVMASRGSRSNGMLLKGVIPADENKVSELLKSVRIGSSAALAPQPDAAQCPPGTEGCTPELPPIVLGKELANTIGATVGSIVLVTSPQGEVTPFGLVPRFTRFKVVGIFDSGFYDYDLTWGFVRLADAQRISGLENVVSVIEFKLDDLYKAVEVGSALQQAAGPGFMTTNWMEQNKAFFRALRLEGVVTFFIIGLIVLVAALNILISLIMMVMEKTRDIAVLVSMGARRRQIRRIFILQGVLIGVIGTAVGLLAGYAIAFLGAKYHFISLSAEVYSIDYVPFAPRALHGVIIASVALLVSFVATLYPSWSATRVLPAEALRYE
ncbi:MAG TPA: FtsX-like permease family protein [Alphaproteobacteria bacterium]|nr:FtsX-like permease family protein [Alphaproteobacteria bacterium]